jgi:hypothetical protein
MRLLLFALLLVPMLSFANPVSDDAARNGEFCDDQPPDKASDEVHGGHCEVDMMISDKSSMEAQPALSLRDLRFNDALLASLGGSFWFNTEQLDLDSGVEIQKEEATLIELSFTSRKDATVGGHLLAISFFRDKENIAIVADWLATPVAGWSFADAKQTSAAQKLGSAVLPFGPANSTSFPTVDIAFYEEGVFVGVSGGAAQFFKFQSEQAQWTPYRLRNGYVTVNQIKSGIGARLDWPMLQDY